MNIAISTTLHTDFDDAVTRTRNALQQQGFGVLTEIDMKATIKAKLGTDMEDYLILGACNPPLAHQAVTIDRQIGLLLPCNVVVRAHPTDTGTVIIEAMNPMLMVDVTDEPALKDIADQATTKLQAAIDALTA
ncbi:DUF302 domain-containing protein [Mycolicibacterium aubagnense]|uniref:ABC transporter n=1 Tax=Mycolicibacterium aubagnense TaxID=319707 RepID=A0ABM7IMZ4_9MYCO|nr:DUF302 domain-containing protein [Mycolicibacterium aubagnense]TLH56825.1 ABC transporter [Mycolicibacterium aubagnense]WGI33966.1 DUF302 domain-containing protein [Mycolicibacterium aubagnense]BBX84256.1 ABC transporter [Mycolicibacterium aubagnense]BBX88153.1 ABC transporter [Mycolicibacterium aubagnense]